MSLGSRWWLAALGVGVAFGPAVAGDLASASLRDARVVRVQWQADAVVKVQTRRGQVTHIVLGSDEQIVGVPATGQGSDCNNPADTWCVMAADVRDLFVKPKAGATVNNMVVITTKRRHAFELVAGNAGAMRVSVIPPAPLVAPAPAMAAVASAPAAVARPVPPAMSADDKVANRLAVLPMVRNSEYSIAVGKGGDALTPAMVFDDGRFTYFVFAPNAPLPALFSTGADGAEEAVNARMNEAGQLVADRVARRFVLRAGDAVAAIVNEAYDADGTMPEAGTAVPGVSRVLKQAQRSEVAR